MGEMVRKICLDSDIVIELLNNNSGVIESIRRLDAEFYTTAINSFELWYGRKNSELIEELLEWAQVLHLGDYDSRLAGDILRKLKNEGKLIDIKDLFIASICIRNKIELLTNN